MSEGDSELGARLGRALEAAGWRRPPGRPVATYEASRALLRLRLDVEAPALRLVIAPLAGQRPLSLTASAEGPEALEDLLGQVLELQDELRAQTVPALLDRLAPRAVALELDAGGEPVDVEAVRRGRLDVAARLGSWTELYDEALGEIAQERWAVAIDALERVVAQRPDFAEAWHNLGHARRVATGADEGALERALELYTARLERDPGDADAAYWTACALAELDRIDEALGALARACAIEADYAREAAVEPDLAPLRRDPRFGAALEGQPPSGG